jgi:collagenase-like PrtC family protease
VSSRLKFAVGYQLPDFARFADIVSEFRDDISEVYFPWRGVAGGRGISIADSADQCQLEEELTEIRQLGIKLDLLWNATCYGGRAISVELEKQVVESVGTLVNHVGLETVTTTSLFVASTVHQHFPGVEVRASVNMGIGTVSGMRYVQDCFDSFYVQRELNRFPERLKPLRQWCNANGKKLYLLANSGCLRHCSAHAFHDNLVSHQHELGCQENRWPGFAGVCWPYFRKPENHVSFLTDSTWIRPEDLDAYAGLVDGVKLATRSHRNPGAVIAAYTGRSLDGNMLSLCEPDFSALAFLDNLRFPDDWAAQFAQLPEEDRELYCKRILADVNS